MKGLHRTPEKRTGLLTRSDLLGMCVEKRSFYRAISGLHASINMHISAIYPTVKTFPVAETTWGPNFERFKYYFSPETTTGQGSWPLFCDFWSHETGPDWLKNLYFTYSLVKQAITKAVPLIEKMEYRTGNDEKDAATKLLMSKLLTVLKFDAFSRVNL